MAIEENSDPLSAQTFPDYTQMIMEAIEALDEEEGSSTLAISNFIESNYSDLTLTLTPAHSTLLSNTLEKLKEAGHLLFCNGNYLKPMDLEDDTPAVKRGRGRPPKAGRTPVVKESLTASGPTRSRGRPPKARDPLAPAPEPKKISVRGRGRPRKYPKEDDATEAEGDVEDEEVAVTAAASGVKRGRGRPPKVKA